VELKCNLAAAIAWLEFEQDGREVAAERGLKPEHQGGIPAANKKRRFRGEFFAYIPNIVSYQGMKEGGMEDRSNAPNHMLSLDDTCSVVL